MARISASHPQTPLPTPDSVLPWLKRGAVRQRKGNKLKKEAIPALIAAGKQRRHPDGNGLYLDVRAPGRAYWVYRYQSGGRTRELPVGSARDFSLADARVRHMQARAYVAAGGDPLAARDTAAAEKAEAAGEFAPRTWAAVCDAFLTERGSNWKHPKHAQQWRNSLASTYEAIGGVPVRDIDTHHVIKVLKPIWETTPESASRLRGRIEQVLNYAAVHGMRRRENNPATWTGHLEFKFEPKSRLQPTEHHPAIDWREMPEFMAKLAVRQQTSMAARALGMAILTCVRSQELRGMRFDEVRGSVWTVPGGPNGRMKGTNPPPHRVPLSAATLAIINQMHALVDGSGLVFPSLRYGKELSDAALVKVLRGLGRMETVHGFRSTFRDWAAEQNKWTRDVIERVLAHGVSDKTEAAYERTDLLELRRPVMEAWAAFLSGETVRARRRAA